MFPAIRERKVWWLTFVLLAICSINLFDKWDELWVGNNFVPIVLAFLVPALAIYLLFNISTLRQDSVEPLEGTEK